MSGDAPLSVICLTEPRTSLQAQALGLAEALDRRLGARIEVRTLALRPWARRLPWRARDAAGRWLASRPGTILADAAALAPVSGSGPRLVIGAGRSSAPFVATLAARTGARSIQILDPALPADLFDIVVLPEHDGVAGPNVLTSLGALGRITPERVAAAAALQPDRFAALPGPRVAVLLGGPSPDFVWGRRDALALVAACRRLARDHTLLVTPSPRSDPRLVAALRRSSAPGRTWIWDGTGPNPYPAMLGHAGAVLATEDSVSMVSEAASSGLPVHVFRLSGRSAAMAAFHASLRRRGIARDFDGRIERWHCPPLAEADRIAAAVELRLLGAPIGPSERDAAERSFGMGAGGHDPCSC